MVEVIKRHGPHSHQRALPDPELGGPQTALLIIDMQYHGASREDGLIKKRLAEGNTDAVAYVLDRIEGTTVPSIQRLQSAFRAAHMEVVHVKTQSLTKDGRDRGPAAKRHGTHMPPGTRSADILDEIAPAGDEIVISKTCSGVFNCTNIDYVLRNVGISTLVIGGMVTGSCVDLAARDAADRGYFVVVAEDATASWSAEMQAQAIENLRDRSAKIMTAAEVIARIGASPLDGHAHERPARETSSA
jgi:nicotinamidase-related amidase